MRLDEMKRLAADTVATALSRGADTAEVSVSDQERFGASVRNGDIENLTESRSSRISVTLSVDKRKSSITSSDLTSDSIKRFIDEAIELASLMDRDEYFALPDTDETGVAEEGTPVFDEKTCEVTADEKISMARSLEDAALAMDGRIISDGASVSSGIFSAALSNSNGFCEGYRQTWASMDVSLAIDEKNDDGNNTGRKQSSYWFSTSPSIHGLDDIEQIASTAVYRTLWKLGAVKPATCEVPVIFDQVTARTFLGWLASALSGRSVYRRETFLADMIGETVSSPLVTMIDDPLMPGRIGSRPFDGEGVVSRKNTLIENGVLKSYLLGSYEARKLSMRTTGNSGGISNFYMSPGKDSLSDMIEGTEEGLLLTSLSGPGANWSSGDLSQGGQGIWISGGRLSHPVNEFTVAGTFPAILSAIDMLEDSLDWRSSIAAPSFRVRSMTISGR